MFLLSAIKKALSLVLVNENCLTQKNDTDVTQFAIKNNRLVIRHATFGNNQRLKLELTAINDDFSHVDTEFYSVATKVFNQLVDGAIRLGLGSVIKYATIDFNLDDKKIGTPILIVGEYSLVIPCDASSKFVEPIKKANIDYDCFFSKESHLLRTSLNFDVSAIKTVAKKDVRYYLTGVALNFINLTDDCYLVDLVATDGHRLNVFKKIIHKKDVVTANDFAISSEPLIIGDNGYKVLTKLINNNQSVYFGIHSNIGGASIIVFESELNGIKISLAMQTIDAKYPNYNKVAKLALKTHQIKIDINKLEAMINYVALYLIGDRATRYKTAVFNIDTNDGYIHLSCIPNHDHLVTVDSTVKTKTSDKEKDCNSLLSKIDNGIFDKISDLALKYRFDCESIEKEKCYKIGFNLDYIKDIIDVFKKNGDKAVFLQFSLENAREYNNIIGNSVLFKNYTDDIPVNETGNILSVLMPVRL